MRADRRAAERYDYPANRGELDRQEYVRRKPDPISIMAGCIAMVISLVVMLGAVFLIGGWIFGRLGT